MISRRRIPSRKSVHRGIRLGSDSSSEFTMRIRRDLIVFYVCKTRCIKSARCDVCLRPGEEVAPLWNPSVEIFLVRLLLFLFIVVNFFFCSPPTTECATLSEQNQQLTQMIKNDPGAGFLYIPSRGNRIFLVPKNSVRLLGKPGWDIHLLFQLSLE